MSLIASICNIRTEFVSGLLRVNEDLSGFKYLEMTPEFPRTGVTGLALSEDLLVAVSQGGTVSVLDRRTFSHLGSTPPQVSKDTHSITFYQGRLYAVATGLNAVVAMNLDKGVVVSEAVVWKMSNASYGADNDHLNSICVHEGRLLVSGFGPRESSLWSSARDGFVMDMVSGKKLHEGLCQPHTVTSLGSRLLVCESARSRVLDLTGGKVAKVDGYVRGLCSGPMGIYAAVSKGRTVSRSTGLAVTNPEDGGDANGRSAIYLIDPDTFLVKKVLETGDLEFFDLLKLDRKW